MATVMSNQGLTSSFPGGSVTHLAPPQNPQQDLRAPLFQIPLGFLQSTANNYGSMAGGLGQIGTALGGMAGQQSGALAGLGNAYANNYGAYGQTLGSIAQSQAAERAAQLAAMGGAAQANQASLGNLWTQALASFGGMGNQALLSMGQGQQGYQNALTGMQGANQQALAQMQGANQAARASMQNANQAAQAGMLGSAMNAYQGSHAADQSALMGMQNANQQSLAQSLGSTQGALANAIGSTQGSLAGMQGSALGGLAAMDVAGQFGGPGMDGSFSATGPGGSIASGSYGGGGGGGMIGGGVSPGDLINLDAEARRQALGLGYDGMGEIVGAGDRAAYDLASGNRDAMSQLGSAGMDIRNRIGSDREAALSSLLASNNSAVQGLADADSQTRGQALDANRMAMDRLDRQQDLYRRDYSNMLGQGMLGLLTMGREGSGAMRTGMGDFYSNVNRGGSNFGQYLDAAGSGFGQSSRDISAVGDRMSRDYGAGLGALQGLAGQIGSGMSEANNTAMDFTKTLLDRFMPTSTQQYQESARLAAMRAADAQTAAMRSPYSAANRMPAMSSMYQSALGMSPQRANAMARDITYGRAGPRPFNAGQMAALSRYSRMA